MGAVLLALVALSALSTRASPAPPAPFELHLDAWLECPGGPLRFGLRLRREEERARAWLVNGTEEIEVPRVVWAEGRVLLDIAHYDATVEARASESGARLEGTWRKRRGADRWAELPFHATAGESEDAAEARAVPTQAIDGRWRVRFEKDEDDAVGLFETAPDGSVSGTFLTTLGDYRFLSGKCEQGRLEISCFDGAHAFLFTARLDGADRLSGDFWSGDSWHETWTARRDPQAALPDAFELNRAREDVDLASLVYPDLEGLPRSLADEDLAGRARILQVFGTWCPNCNDETPFLVELDRRYRARGLRILGLAFELTGDPERDALQVRRHAERFGVEYPILLAGTSDKSLASQRFPLLDRIRAYPTTIFLDGQGDVRAIHTGFSGPATGEEHLRLRERFEALIEEILAEDERPAR